MFIKTIYKKDISYDIILLEKTVTPESLIAFRHFSHDSDDPDPENPGVNNLSAKGGDEKIQQAEQRLGVKLPEILCAVYRIYNGGSINDVCIVKDGIKNTKLEYDDIIKPFSGYDELNPMEHLDTAWESFTSFGDPDDQETYGQFFRSGTENMIVLAQWYRETLFLDYNLSSEPRVGFVDFDLEDWEDRVHWWPNFSDFFAELRHYSQ